MDNLNIDNNIITDPVQISIELNRFFIQITEKLIKGLSEKTNYTPRSLTVDADMTMYLRSTTDAKIARIIGQLKTNIAL